jgi:GAF domain-containing protein
MGVGGSNGSVAGDGGSRGRPSAAYRGQDVDPNDLAETLGRLARSLQDQADVGQTLTAVVHAAAADTVPGAEEASISAVIRRREVRTLAGTGELAEAVDQAQYDTGDGPCLDVLYDHISNAAVRPEHRAVLTTLHHHGRRTGLRSRLGVQLYVRGEDLGALNLHSRQPDAFTDESERDALLFTTHAAVALASAQQQAQLRIALDSRDIIGQAKGILMERYKIGADEAFRLLGRDRLPRLLHDPHRTSTEVRVVLPANLGHYLSSSVVPPRYEG